MSDNRSALLTVELITRCINELAQKVGAMEPGDRKGAAVISRTFPTNAGSGDQENSQAITSLLQCMDELAREMTRLKPRRSSPSTNCPAHNVAQGFRKRNLGFT